MRLGLPGSVIDDCAPPIIARCADDYWAPVDLFDFGVVSVGNLRCVAHDAQPRCRQKHYAIAGIAVKAKNDLTVPAFLGRAEAYAIEP